MKLFDLMSSVKRGEDDGALSMSFDLQDLMVEVFGQDANYWEFDHSKFYEDKIITDWMLTAHYDTDAYIGTSVLYVRDSPIALMTLKGRKCDIDYQFISKTHLEILKSALNEYIVKQDHDEHLFLVQDELMEDVGITFHPYSADALLTSEGFYRDMLVTVRGHHQEGKYCFEQDLLEVTFECGNMAVIHVDHVGMLFNVRGL